MSGPVQKVYRDNPVKCPQCKTGEVTYVMSHICDTCRVINYLTFRHAFGWAMTEDDYKRLGLKLSVC
jgi:hypothetical protein